jgi:hypothetical protein
MSFHNKVLKNIWVKILQKYYYANFRQVSQYFIFKPGHTEFMQLQEDIREDVSVFLQVKLANMGSCAIFSYS